MVAILYPEEWRMMLEERVWRLERQRYIANTKLEFQKTLTDKELKSVNDLVTNLAQSWLEKDRELLNYRMAIHLIFHAQTNNKDNDCWVDYGKKVEQAIEEARQLLERGKKNGIT